MAPKRGGEGSWGTYAVVIGEALVDLLEAEVDGDRLYRPAIGGAPLNVAVGIARLGAGTGVGAEFVGLLGNDSWADRINEFLIEAGVGTRGVVTAEAATTLAMTTYDGVEPDFQFYGTPPSYGLLGDIEPALVAGSGVLYCGSICLLCARVLEAARVAWCRRPVRSAPSTRTSDRGSAPTTTSCARWSPSSPRRPTW